MHIIHLYTTLGCHLCEQALAIVEPYVQGFAATVELVEIADSDELIARYGVRIPVLQVKGSKAELAWPFDEVAVNAWLKTQFV